VWQVPTQDLASVKVGFVEQTKLARLTKIYSFLITQEKVLWWGITIASGQLFFRSDRV